MEEGCGICMGATWSAIWKVPVLSPSPPPPSYRAPPSVAPPVIPLRPGSVVVPAGATETSLSIVVLDLFRSSSGFSFVNSTSSHPRTLVCKSSLSRLVTHPTLPKHVANHGSCLSPLPPLFIRPSYQPRLDVDRSSRSLSSPLLRCSPLLHLNNQYSRRVDQASWL